MRTHFQLTRTHSYSLLFALPLLLLYETGAALLEQGTGPALRNGADVLLRVLLITAGVRDTRVLSALLLAAGAALILLERRRREVPLRARHFVGMGLESVGYALALGIVVGHATQWLLSGLRLATAGGALDSLSLPEGFVLSLGAGLYEELVFRVLLVGGIFLVMHAAGLTRRSSGLVAALLAALLFSAFHYVGPYGDPWALPSFVFRFLAGLAFSILFLLRGFGITAWTHALYDVFLLTTRGFG